MELVGAADHRLGLLFGGDDGDGIKNAQIALADVETARQAYGARSPLFEGDFVEERIGIRVDELVA